MQMVTINDAAPLTALYDGESSSQSSMPIFFITFDPPSIVPNVRADAHKSKTKRGMSFL